MHSVSRRGAEDCRNVATNLRLLVGFGAHVDVERVNSASWLTDLCKYLCKAEPTLRALVHAGPQRRHAPASGSTVANPAATHVVCENGRAIRKPALAKLPL